MIRVIPIHDTYHRQYGMRVRIQITKSDADKLFDILSYLATMRGTFHEYAGPSIYKRSTHLRIELRVLDPLDFIEKFSTDKYPHEVFDQRFRDRKLDVRLRKLRSAEYIGE